MTDATMPSGNYATTANLETRSSVWRPGDDGRMPMDVVIDMIVELAPRRFLDIGTGMGKVPAAVKQRLPECLVHAVDQSPAMVEATRAKGITAEKAFIEHLPLPDATYDVISATWMLYHVENLDAALREVRRVLAPEGTFVAATNGEQHVIGLFEMSGTPQPALSFTRENGEEILRRHFEHVERLDLTSYAEFANSDAAQTYLRTIVPDAVMPPFDEPLRLPGAPTVFVAR